MPHRSRRCRIAASITSRIKRASELGRAPMGFGRRPRSRPGTWGRLIQLDKVCLLYTSDAADDM
eukprot:6758994-Alexandrium_andersonii.AAC.1